VDLISSQMLMKPARGKHKQMRRRVAYSAEKVTDDDIGLTAQREKRKLY
jgi:hypothetical protein